MSVSSRYSVRVSRRSPGSKRERRSEEERFDNNDSVFLFSSVVQLIIGAHYLDVIDDFQVSITQIKLFGPCSYYLFCDERLFDLVTPEIIKGSEGPKRFYIFVSTYRQDLLTH